MTTPMTTTPTPTPTTPPPSPMHAVADDVNTQVPVVASISDDSGTTSQVPPPVVAAAAPVNYTDRIKLAMAEVVRDVDNRAKAERAEAYDAFVQVFRLEAKACAVVSTSKAFAIHEDKIIQALEGFLLIFKSCLNDKLRANLASEALSNPQTVCVPEVLPFNIVGKLSSPHRRGAPSLYDVDAKVIRMPKGSTQGSVFAAARSSAPPTGVVNQRKRKRRQDKHSSPRKPAKSARVNPLWTDKEIKQLRERVFKHAVHVLAATPLMTPTELAERISNRISKGKYIRSPSAVVKKTRSLGLVLTHPKNEALIRFLNAKNLMQYVPKRFQPTTTTTTTTPSVSEADDKYYTEEEITHAESKEPITTTTTTTTTALAKLIASIPALAPTQLEVNC